MSMELRTYRARSMQEALEQIRRDLGPDAAVLHTRQIGSHRLLRWIPGLQQIEVTAGLGVQVPSRLPPRDLSPAPDPFSASAASLAPAVPSMGSREAGQRHSSPAEVSVDTKQQFRQELKGQIAELQSMVEDLCRRSQRGSQHDLPEGLFHLYTDLIEAEIPEELARDLVERARRDAPADELSDPALLRRRVARQIEQELAVAGPIVLEPQQRRLVALVGPTGVGKTTTIAKLAANFRLREKRRVGLITVDTYRIAAVEQLRTYADIIDLPMEVVSTPRQMREALARMEELDLVLMDTAGRSPRDEVRIQELKAFLTEAQADEVHLVLSCVTGATTLQRTAEQFAAVGTTHLLLTKLDEATGLGSLLQLARVSRLPLSYLTDGQNVPDDIQPADCRQVARLILGDAPAAEEPRVWHYA